MQARDYVIVALITLAFVLVLGTLIGQLDSRVKELDNKVDRAIIDQTKQLVLDSIKLHEIHLSVDSLGIRLKSKGYLK